LVCGQCLWGKAEGDVTCGQYVGWREIEAREFYFLRGSSEGGIAASVEVDFFGSLVRAIEEEDADGAFGLCQKGGRAGNECGADENGETRV
jgi:hypothetical protein